MKPSRLLTHLITHLVLRAVPQHLRESVHGDLLEQQVGTREALAVALHFQAEPWRDRTDRRDALALLLAAAGLLWIVPMAATSLLAQAAVFSDPFSRAGLLLWQAPTVLAAVACGLLIGRVSLLPPQADAARLHVVLLLVPVAALRAPGLVQGVLAGGLMVAAAWLAHQNRQVSHERAETA